MDSPADTLNSQDEAVLETKIKESLSDALGRLKKQIETLPLELESLRRRAESAESEHGQFASKYESQQVGLGTLVEQLGQQKQKCDEILTVNERLEAQAADHRRLQVVLQGQIALLGNERDQALDEVKKSSNKLRSIEQDLATLRAVNEATKIDAHIAIQARDEVQRHLTSQRFDPKKLYTDDEMRDLVSRLPLPTAYLRCGGILTHLGEVLSQAVSRLPRRFRNKFLFWHDFHPGDFLPHEEMFQWADDRKINGFVLRPRTQIRITDIGEVKIQSGFQGVPSYTRSLFQAFIYDSGWQYWGTYRTFQAGLADYGSRTIQGKQELISGVCGFDDPFSGSVQQDTSAILSLDQRQNIWREVEKMYSSGEIILEYVGIECVQGPEPEVQEELKDAVAAAVESIKHEEKPTRIHSSRTTSSCSSEVSEEENQGEMKQKSSRKVEGDEDGSSRILRSLRVKRRI